MRDQLLQYEKMSIMGRLAAGIAHEIRNPLSAVSLNLQYLAQKHKDDAELCEALRDALEGAKRVEVVIENTLSLARVTPPVLGSERLNTLVDQVSTFVKISVQQKDIHLETRLGEGLPDVTVDAKQVQQVILNIVQNAIDASPERGVVELSTLLEEEPGEAGSGGAWWLWRSGTTVMASRRRTGRDCSSISLRRSGRGRGSVSPCRARSWNATEARSGSNQRTARERSPV